jgi:hypothetical protein
MTTTELRKGSIVRVAGGFGAEYPVLAEVVEVYDDIKNNKPGIAYGRRDERGELHSDRWAYLYQVREVVKY